MKVSHDTIQEEFEKVNARVRLLEKEKT